MPFYLLTLRIPRIKQSHRKMSRYPIFIVFAIPPFPFAQATIMMGQRDLVAGDERRWGAFVPAHWLARWLAWSQPCRHGLWLRQMLFVMSTHIKMRNSTSLSLVIPNVFFPLFGRNTQTYPCSSKSEIEKSKSNESTGRRRISRTGERAPSLALALLSSFPSAMLSLNVFILWFCLSPPLNKYILT